MRLTDLRVVEGSGMFIDLKADLRPATISDLIAALIEQGGEVRSYTAVPWSPLETGRYLVFRIPDDYSDPSS